MKVLTTAHTHVHQILAMDTDLKSHDHLLQSMFVLLQSHVKIRSFEKTACRYLV